MINLYFKRKTKAETRIEQLYVLENMYLTQSIVIFFKILDFFSDGIKSS